MSPGFWHSYLQVGASPTAAELPLRARGLQGLGKMSGMEPSAGCFYSDPGRRPLADHRYPGDLLWRQCLWVQIRRFTFLMVDWSEIVINWNQQQK